MASISAAAATAPPVACAAVVPKAATGFSAVLGLPQMGVRGGRVRCSASKKAPPMAPVSMGVAALAAAAAAASELSTRNTALALVDERMSTEGTGLSLGVSNNLLGWILFGIFGLIWAFYVVYTSTLEEDEESGLSL